MPNFLLITVPFCSLNHRYFAAAYLAEVVRKAKWKYFYLDLNTPVYNGNSPDDKLKSSWNASDQYSLFDNTKGRGREILRHTLKKQIEQTKPDLIGFSLMSSNRLYAQLAMEVLSELKANVPVIFGGPDCFPREYYKTYFSIPSPPNLILKGEAEIALPEFLREFTETHSIETKIKGFVYKNNRGELIDTGPPVIPYLRDDTLPADYSVFDYLDSDCELDNTIFTFCSKGCINKCAFCSESRNYQPYRRRQAQEVINDIRDNLKKIPKKYKGRAEIAFRDSIFNASPKYVKEICNLLISSHLNIRWFCLGGFRVVLSDDIFDLMKKSGCKSIFFGFESASQRVADLMGKNFDVFSAQQTIDQCLHHNIEVILPIINGFPGEFTRDFITSMAFILRYRNKVNFGYSNTCGIFKGTPLSEHPNDFFISEVEEVNYKLRDGYNVFPVRQLRQVINEALCKKIQFKGNKALCSINFNDLPAAAEIAQIIYYLCNFLGRRLNDFLPCINDTCRAYNDNATSLGQYNYLNNIIPGISLNSWLQLDKNELSTKNKIISKIDKLIEEFEYKLLKKDEINFSDFRRSLYEFSTSSAPPPTFTVLSERFSKYDKGKHIIFEASIIETSRELAISKVEARCGDYCFDIHHWQEYGTDKVTNIWGKVKASMLHENPLEMRVIYGDGSTCQFEFPFTIMGTLKPTKKNRILSSFRQAFKKLPFLPLSSPLDNFNSYNNRTYNILNITTNKLKMKKRTRYSNTLSLLMILVSIIIGLLIIEAGVRIFCPDIQITRAWSYHSILGWSQVPNAKFKKNWHNYPVDVEFNSLGFRDKEHQLQKPANTKRIAIIGDSFSEAIQVNLEETFYKLLEKKLNAQGTTKWEVLNFGVGDFGTAQEWIALNEYALKFSPDIVIQEIFPLNDICNNTIELFGMCRSYNDRYRPYFVEKDNGGMELTTAQPLRNYIRRYSLTYRLAERAILDHLGIYKRFAEDEFRNTYIKEKGLPELDPLIYTYVNDNEQIEQIKTGWRVTEKILGKTARLCESLNIRYLAIVIPWEARLEPRWSEIKPLFPPPEIHREYPETKFSEIFKRQKIESLMFLDLFQKRKDFVLPYWGGHLQPNGHTLVAEQLYNKLSKNHLVNKSFTDD